MSWLDKLKKAASAAYHGVSPFDRGQGWTSRPVAPRPMAPRPVPQNRPPIRPNPVIRNTAANQSLLNKIIRFGPSAIRDTFTNPKAWQKAPKINVGTFKGSGLIEEFINSPLKIGGGAVKVGRGQVKQGLGDIVTGLIEGPVGFIPVGRAAQATTKGLKLATKIKLGAKVGAQQGAGFGAAYGGGAAASQNANYGDILKSTALGGGIGLAAGTVLGGGLPVAGAGARLAGRGTVKAGRAIQRYDQAQNQIGAIGRGVGGAQGELQVGDVIDTNGKSNMKGKVTVTNITGKGRTIHFTDETGQTYSGFSAATANDLIKGRSWTRAKIPSTPPKSAPILPANETVVPGFGKVDNATGKVTLETAKKPKPATSPIEAVQVEAAAKGFEPVPIQAGGATPATLNDIAANSRVLNASGQQADAAFQKDLADIASSLGVDYRPGPIKTVERIAEKTTREYGGNVGKVRDVVRGTLVVDNPQNLQGIVDNIGRRYQITRVKNGYENMPAARGLYKDIKVNVVGPNGVPSEVIVASPEMIRAKSILDGDKLYKEARTTVDSAKLQELNGKMQKLYAEAESAEAKRLASSGESSVPSTNALAGGKGAPVATTVPVEALPSDTILTRTPSTSKNVVLGTEKSAIKQAPSETIVARNKQERQVATDRFGALYNEQDVPVGQLVRQKAYQPRITESGKATEQSVYKTGYNEGQVDQPMLLWKQGDKYTVLGGHSRTAGLERRAAEGKPNPATIKGRVYENITDEQARQISRGANQGLQYENTLDMAKSIAGSVAEGKKPSVQTQNLVKGHTFEDYDYLWSVVKDQNLLQNRVAAGAIPSEEVLAVARQARLKDMKPETVAAVISGLDKSGNFSRQNAVNVINLLSGKIKAGVARDAQTGLFGTVEQAVNATDLLKEHQKISADLTKQRNALTISAKLVGKRTPAYKQLKDLVVERNNRLKNLQDEIVQRYKKTSGAAVGLKETPKVAVKTVEAPSKPKPLSAAPEIKAGRLPGVRPPLAGFTKSAKASPELSSETRRLASERLQAGKTEAQLVEHAQRVSRGDLGAETERIKTVLEQKTVKITDQDAADTISLMKAQDALGTKEGHRIASELIDQLAAHGTPAGRLVNAFGLLANRTPTGLLYAAKRDLRKAGVNVTPEIEKQLQTSLDGVRAAKNGTEAHDLAVHDFIKIVGQHLPSSVGEKGIGLWRAGLLTSPTTTLGSVLGNTSKALLNLSSSPLATAYDAALAAAGKTKLGRRIGLKGERTQTLTLRGKGVGLKEGSRKGARNLRTGYDERAYAPKFEGGRRVLGQFSELNFGKGKTGRAATKYVNSVYRWMGAQDMPFWYSELRNSLQSQARASAKNAGLRGEAAKAHIDGILKEPPTEIFRRATQSADESTFRNQTALGWLGRQIQKLPGGQVIVPFAKVPSSVATMTIRYTPIGPMKEIFNLARKPGEFDQYRLSKALGDATLGTAGIMSLGYGLMKGGNLTLDYPDDPKEQALWDQEGKQPFAVKLGGRWFSMNYIQPFGTILAVGGSIKKAMEEGKNPVTQGAATIGSSLSNQSFLRGLSTALQTLTDPDRSVGRFVQNTAGSLIPNLVKRFAAATDNIQRDINNAGEAIKAGIPGLRQTLQPKQDVFGANKPNTAGFWGTMFDATRSRPASGADQPLIKELRRLQDAKLGVMPSVVDKNQTFDGAKVKLSNEQMFELQAAIGGEVHDAWSTMLKDPAWKNLSDTDKKKALSNVLDDITAATKQQFAAQYSLGQYDPAFTGKAQKLSAKQNAILEGKLDPANYLRVSATGLQLAKNLSPASYKTLTEVDAMPSDKKEAYLASPKNNYDYELAKYENDKANGNLSSTRDFEHLLDLGKLKVKADYSEDVVNLYTLSKRELSGYVAQHPITQKIADELIALDNELYSKGFIANRKYKSGLTGSGGGGSSSKRKAPLPHFGSFNISAPPKIGLRPDINSVLSDFQRKVAGIPAIKSKGQKKSGGVRIAFRA